MSLTVLALDTSHRPGSVALAAGNAGELTIRGYEDFPDREATAQVFATRVRTLLRSAGIPPQAVGLVAVDIGPGSFTGLRIAATFAKTFAYATGADLAGISSMEVLAHRVAAAAVAPARRLWTLIDAHRGQLFAARYEVAPGHYAQAAEGLRMVEIDDLLGEFQTGDLVTGPIVGRLKHRLPAGVDAVASALWVPSAESVARIAWRNWQDGRRDDLWRLAPLYYRRSAAEERQGPA